MTLLADTSGPSYNGEPGWASAKVYREGWDAVFGGRQRTENPYERGGTWHAAWIIGYDDALRERAKEPADA